MGYESAAPAAPEVLDQRNFQAYWREIKLVSLLFGLLLASSLVLGVVTRFYHSHWPEVIVAAIDALIVGLFACLYHRKILPLLRLPDLSGRAALETLVIAIGFFMAMGSYFALLERLGVPVLRVSDHYRSAGWNLIAVLVLVSLMPALVEELAFRGVIQSSLEDIFRSRDALIIQAALFSILHLWPMMFPSHFIMGLCFGYARSRWKSLYPSMILHASWNAFVLYRELNWT